MPPRNATWSDSSQLVRSHVRKKERGEGKRRKKIREGRHAAGDTCCFVRKNPRQPAHQALVNNGAPVYLNAPDRSRMPVGEFFPVLPFCFSSLPPSPSFFLSRLLLHIGRSRDERLRACAHAPIYPFSKKGRRTPSRIVGRPLLRPAMSNFTRFVPRCRKNRGNGWMKRDGKGVVREHSGIESDGIREFPCGSRRANPRRGQ